MINIWCVSCITCMRLKGGMWVSVCVCVWLCLCKCEGCVMRGWVCVWVCVCVCVWGMCDESFSTFPKKITHSPCPTKFRGIWSLKIKILFLLWVRKSRTAQNLTLRCQLHPFPYIGKVSTYRPFMLHFLNYWLSTTEKINVLNVLNELRPFMLQLP